VSTGFRDLKLGGGNGRRPAVGAERKGLGLLADADGESSGAATHANAEFDRAGLGDPQAPLGRVALVPFGDRREGLVPVETGDVADGAFTVRDESEFGKKRFVGCEQEPSVAGKLNRMHESVRVGDIDPGEGRSELA
jgi:hypothetical protein